MKAMEKETRPVPSPAITTYTPHTVWPVFNIYACPSICSAKRNK